MSALTPGQALVASLVETGTARFGVPAGSFRDWDRLPGWEQERMESAARAAIGADATAAELRLLVRDMLGTMGPSRQALAFAIRAGKLGVTGTDGRALVPACMPEGGDGGE